MQTPSTETRGRGQHKRKGTPRRDRIFRVYMDLPPHIPEDEMMDYIEEAVTMYRHHIQPRRAGSFDADTVAVKRHTKKYAEET